MLAVDVVLPEVLLDVDMVMLPPFGPVGIDVLFVALGALPNPPPPPPPLDMPLPVEAVYPELKATCCQRAYTGNLECYSLITGCIAMPGVDICIDLSSVKVDIIHHILLIYLQVRKFQHRSSRFQPVTVHQSDLR